MKKLFLFFLITGIFLNLNSAPAFAQLKIDSYNGKLIITPGETSTGSITIENPTKETVTVKVSLSDIELVPPFERGGIVYKPAGTTADSFSSWITISPEIFNLPASGKQKVTYTVKPPVDAKGGYYGTIFFEKNSQKLGQGFGIIFKLGYTLSLVTKDAVSSIKSEDVSLSAEEVKGKFLNAGDVILNSTYSYNLMDKDGKVLDRGKVEKVFVIPPKGKVPFAVKLPKKIVAGEYDLVITFNLTAGGSLINEVYFSKDNAGNLKFIKATN